MTDNDVMVEEAGELYSLPPNEFTAARNTLAAELKKSGRAEDSAAVKALKKPSLSAWATNQLARRNPDELAALLDAGDRLRSAQEHLLESGDRADLRTAANERREAVTRLVELASGILEGAGATAGRAHLDRIGANLMAAATSGEARALLESGRLSEDLSAGEDLGLGAFAALGTAEPAPPARKVAAARKEVERLERAALEAEEFAKELAQEAARAEQVASQSRMAASDARRAAQESRTRADEARRSL
ncbi:MAG: hypothetical protein ACRDKZ_08775 [Actinomycetota bacterium]